MPITEEAVEKEFRDNTLGSWRAAYPGSASINKTYPWVEIYRLRTEFTEGVPSLVEVEVMKELAEQKGVEVSRDYLFYKRIEDDAQIENAMDHLYSCDSALSKALLRQVSSVVRLAY